MREIKFRAWDTFNERMIDDPYRFIPSREHDYQEGDKRFDAPYQYYEDWQDVEDGINRPCFIMQYTGLKDKNCKEIYEGDILKVFEDYGVMGSTEIIASVKWGNEYPAFTLEPEAEDLEYNSLQHASLVASCEVIGNIYETPELIKKQNA